MSNKLKKNTGRKIPFESVNSIESGGNPPTISIPATFPAAVKNSRSVSGGAEATWFIRICLN